jgi:hypothetical protein
MFVGPGQGGANAHGSLLGFGTGTSSLASYSTCGQGDFGLGEQAPQPVPIGVVLPAVLDLSVSAFSVGPTDDDNGGALFTGFQFFDLQGDPVSGVDYTFEIQGVPEPVQWPVVLLLVCGCFLCARILKAS